MVNIQAQQKLSQDVALLLGQVIKRNYQVTEEAVDIGSYSRGTNTDPRPDIDLLFVGIPHNIQSGFVDWTEVDTFSIVHTWDGITEIEDILQLDPILFTTITQSLQLLETFGSNAQFCSVRAWIGDPQVVFTVSVDHEVYGMVNIDVTLSYPTKNFGVEHARRFHLFIKRIIQTHGEERALQLVEDMRKLKTLVKAEASPHGKVDRMKKVPGFLIEAFFMFQFEPLTYDEVLIQLQEHQWLNDEKPELPERIQNQEEQLIEANKSFQDLLYSVTKGGYLTLKRVASRELKRIMNE